jgi:maltooligosyltrehalose trehalohydrolase
MIPKEGTQSMTWLPSLGAWPDAQATHFRVWAPTTASLTVVLEGPGKSSHPLSKDADGFFSAMISGVHAGDRYRCLVDGRGPFPDPASRFQPEGVHGPSEVVDAKAFVWSDAGWKGIGLDELVIYELHVGTFTPAGTFAAVIDHLEELVKLGMTAIELMPIADFPGRWNWGYDGVGLFAPARCYGRPDDLRRLVNSAHERGLAVLLDVVYNHLGPDGNYLGAFSPFYFSNKEKTAWGTALNLDGAQSRPVREFFIENALHWIHEYHFDGLRLDATHALFDTSKRHFLTELAERVHDSVRDRQVLVIAEDHRNLATMIKPPAEGGWGLDAVWADDFHHQIRRCLASDHEGYYRDFTGKVTDLATTIRQGWFYCGQHSIHFNEPRGTDPSSIPPRRFVHCLQNHDQIGNRATGDRLHHQIDLASYRAATVLLLCSPATPLLFMGQEWAATTPFLFFTDHKKELGQKVTEGRRQEFKNFSAFTDPAARQKIPDPQAEATFQASKLRWTEKDQEPHASIFRLYRTMLHLRRDEPALRASERGSFELTPINESAVILVRHAPSGPSLIIIVQLRGAGAVDFQKDASLPSLVGRRWQTLLTTEDAEFCPDSRMPEIDLAQPAVRFFRPGAVILKEHSHSA